MATTQRCGDFGGRNVDGSPCRNPSNGPCRLHPNASGPARFVEAMLDSGGVLKNVAQKLDVPRSEVVDAIARWPEVRAALREEEEKVGDLIKERMIEQANQGNIVALKWCAENLKPQAEPEEARKGAGHGQAWA